MAEEVFVSIVIPIYNTESFLRETLESVLSQTMKEIEIILVNDGSSDNSASLCKDYQKKDSRIIYVEQENQGVSIARNNGLLMASGDYIYFMDSDDTIEKEYIKSSYDIAIKDNAEVVVIGDYYCNRIFKIPVLPTCAMLISKNVLTKNPFIRFPENIQPCEDGIFSHMLLSEVSKISLNPKGVYYYRQHENQNHVKIDKNTIKVVEKIPEWLNILQKFYAEKGMKKKYALHLALFIQHEPFGMRYLKMPLNNLQKQFLYKLIKVFTQDNFWDYLTDTDKERLHPLFLKFLKSKTLEEFEEDYNLYLKKIKRKESIVKFIPIKKYRKSLRKKIKENQDL